MHLAQLRKRLLKQRRFRQLLVSSVFLAIAFGLIIVPIERRSADANILTTSDGLWWSIQTLTTVGYGDVSPVTESGRVLGVLMQLVGAVMFGALIALISTSMSRGQEEFMWTRLFERLDRLEEKIHKLEKDSRYLVKGQTDLSSPQDSEPRRDTLG